MCLYPLFLVKRKSLALVMVMVLMAGCGTTPIYSGPRQPREKVAEIVLINNSLYGFYGIQFIVTKIDGIDTNPPFDAKVEVLPGIHSMEGRLVKTTNLWVHLAASLFEKPILITPETLTFRAEAGRTYKMNGKTVPDENYEKWSIWVEDVYSGEVVGGVKPESPDATSPD